MQVPVLVVWVVSVELGQRGAWSIPMHPDIFPPHLCACGDPAVRCPSAVPPVQRLQIVLLFCCRQNFCGVPLYIVLRLLTMSLMAFLIWSPKVALTLGSSWSRTGPLIRLLPAGVILRLIGERILHPLLILQVMPCLLQLDQPCRREMIPFLLGVWLSVQYRIIFVLPVSLTVLLPLRGRQLMSAWFIRKNGSVRLPNMCMPVIGPCWIPPCARIFCHGLDSPLIGSLFVNCSLGVRIPPSGPCCLVVRQMCGIRVRLTGCCG